MGCVSGDGLGHPGLGRPPCEMTVSVIGDGCLVHEERGRFARHTWLVHAQERNMSGARSRQRRAEGRSDRSITKSENRVDVSGIGPRAAEPLTDLDAHARTSRLGSRP